MNFLDSFAPFIKSILRIVTGLLFLSLGIAKLLHFPSVPMFAHVSLIDWPEGYAGIIETVGGTLMMLGLFSRFAAFICSGEMAFAYFMAHFPKSVFPVINGGEAAILFCFIFLYFAASGPGPIALNQK